MADIKISNLYGFDLFNDTESFMSDINDEVTDSIVGGLLLNCNSVTAICHVGTIIANRVFINKTNYLD